MTAVDFVFLRPDLVPAVFEVEKLSFKEPWSLAQITEEIHFSAALFPVALSDAGECLGYASVRVHPPEMHLNRIAVHPDFRRMGLGKKLLDLCLCQGLEKGAQEIFLEVEQENTAALAMYEKTGFLQVGERPGYYHKGSTNALILKKHLL